MQKFRPQKIILFGSYGYGKPTEDSDVDLLVIMPFDRRKGRKSLEIRRAIPTQPINGISWREINTALRT